MEEEFYSLVTRLNEEGESEEEEENDSDEELDVPMFACSEPPRPHPVAPPVKPQPKTATPLKPQPTTNQNPETPKGVIDKALFIGINYKGTGSELKGCVNDCRTSYNLLTKGLKLTIQEKKIYVDDPKYPGYNGMPTRANIMTGFRWLVEGAKAGTTLFVHYSGHGGQAKASPKSKEKDGQNETLCPLDYEDAGEIEDDELFRVVVEPLPKGARLTAVFDCCHSGTILDLPYMFEASQANLAAATRSRGTLAQDRDASVSEVNGSVVMFSGCKDDQTSADVQGSDPGGALTNALTKAITTGGKKATVVQLLENMRSILVEEGHSQIPQLCSSIPIASASKFSFAAS